MNLQSAEQALQTLQNQPSDAESAAKLTSFILATIDTLRTALWTSVNYLQASTDLARMREDNTTIKDIQSDVKAIRQITAGSKPMAGGLSFAQVAATAPAPAPTPQAPHKPAAVHEITIRIGDATDRAQNSLSTNQAIVAKLQAAAPPDTHSIRAIQKLPSGDIKAYVTDGPTRKKLLEKEEWTQVLGRSARPTKPLVLVEVHGVPTTLAVHGLEAGKTIREIQEENSQVASLQVDRLAWKRPGRVRKGQKKCSSLIMGIATEASANALFDTGLFLRSHHYAVTRHETMFLATQCFQCQGFNHIAANCRKDAKCGHCAGPHNSKNCTEDKLEKCVNCKGRHAAWSSACTVRRTQQAKAAGARAATPMYYRDATTTEASQRGWKRGREGSANADAPPKRKPGQLTKINKLRRESGQSSIATMLGSSSHAPILIPSTQMAPPVPARETRPHQQPPPTLAIATAQPQQEPEETLTNSRATSQPGAAARPLPGSTLLSSPTPEPSMDLSQYRDLLSTPKAAKAVASWFRETGPLPYLTPARERARGRRWNRAPEEEP